MSNDLNQCNFIGRLGKPPETRHTKSGDAVCNFSIACDESWKNKQGEKQESTEWVNIVVFGKLADICSKYLGKGSLIFISGKFKTEKWENKNGGARYTTKIHADKMQMLGPKKDGSEQQADPGARVEAPKARLPDNFDDDIPF